MFCVFCVSLCTFFHSKTAKTSYNTPEIPKAPMKSRSKSKSKYNTNTSTSTKKEINPISGFAFGSDDNSKKGINVKTDTKKTSKKTNKRGRGRGRGRGGGKTTMKTRSGARTGTRRAVQMYQTSQIKRKLSVTAVKEEEEAETSQD